MAFSAAHAEQDSPQWLRNSKISPDGESVLFTYKGDIYTVATKGGEAKQITTHPAYDTKPMWSPSGEQIIFSSNRLGGSDIYIVSAKGGEPTRLTTHSASESPVCFLDESTVLFQANIAPAQYSSQFPSSRFNQTYSVSTSGGRPSLFSAVPMESINMSQDGSQIIYIDYKGYEDPFRKHHQSSIARDVWSADLKDGKLSNHVKITTFAGEDRDPLYAEGSKTEIFYTNEQDNTLNIYKMNLKTGEQRQLTSYKDFPVRSLSIGANNMLCYSWNGELYTLDGNRAGAEPKRIEISIIADKLERDEIQMTQTSGAGNMSLSADGKQIAFVLRGDVYVTSVEYATTKQITNSASQERTVSFSPDGRSVVYDSERDGMWQIYESSIVRKDDDNLVYAVEISERQLTDSKETSFLPKYSPDGKSVAFLENRTELKVINLKSKKTTTVRDRALEYSYADGDQWFEWSPDSQWLLSGYIGNGGWNHRDVAIFKADGSEYHNLTKSGYTDRAARWALNGKAIIWFSDKAGYRSHGSWGSQSDAYIMFFDLESYEKFRMTKEELALLAEQESKDKKAQKEKEKEEEKEGEDGEEKKEKKKEVLELDIKRAEDRILRLTDNSSAISNAILSADGSKLYYLTRFEGGTELWVKNIKEHSTKLLIKNSGHGALIMGSKPTDIFMSSGGSLKKINVANNTISTIPFEAKFTYRPKQEREYMFQHVWKQVQDKFYLEDDLHGAPWEMYREVYGSKLEDISNNSDFAELLSEMLGELNASHTGARHYASGSSRPTANLGLFFDEGYEGDGLKISEIIKHSPLDIITCDVEEGYIIDKIDGVKITAGMDYYPLLEGKANKPVLLSIKKSKGGKCFEQSVKPISSSFLNTLLYHRWIDRCAEMVDSLSDGRLAYIHIEAMNGESFSEMYSKLLGKYRDCEAVIVDTRHNGGGWLHDDVVTLLNGKKYQDFVAHGQYVGSDPFNKWTKPSCMLICENNYSNAHGTPWVYKTLGVGKLIGTPVPGTMTAVWWESLIDASIVFGIPQVGVRDNDGVYAENTELQPDILVYNEVEDVLQGKDSQLERAVKHLLEQLK